MMQSAAMRNGADDPDGASGLYVTAFQVGIMAGSLAGGLLYEHSVTMMLIASAILMAVALVGIAANRRMLDVPAAADKLTRFITAQLRGVFLAAKGPWTPAGDGRRRPPYARLCRSRRVEVCICRAGRRPGLSRVSSPL